MKRVNDRKNAGASVPVKKLGAVNECPGEIGAGGATVWGFGVGGDDFAFLVTGRPGENREIESVDDFTRGPLRLDQRLQLRTLFDLPLNLGGVQQVHPLGGGDSVVSFGIRSGVTRRTTEHFEKRTRDAAVRKCDRAL